MQFNTHPCTGPQEVCVSTYLPSDTNRDSFDQPAGVAATQIIMINMINKSTPNTAPKINFLSLSSSSNRCLQLPAMPAPTSFARSRCCWNGFFSPPSSPPFSGSFFSESWLAASGSFLTGLPLSSIFTSLRSSPSSPSFLFVSSCLSRSSSFSPASTSVSWIKSNHLVYNSVVSSFRRYNLNNISK